MAKPWVFSITPIELWEDLEKWAHAKHQQLHEGRIRNPPYKVGNLKKCKCYTVERLFNLLFILWLCK